MSCSTRDVFSIELPRENVEVLAIETDVRIDRRHYSRAKFKLREEAGKLIEEHHDNNTLAFINVNRERSQRMIIPSDGITFERDLGGNTVAELTLLDARKVLDQQSVEKKFKDVDAREIVEYLLAQRRDPDDVIRGYEFINEGDTSLTATTSWFFESEPGSQSGDIELDIDPFGLSTDIATFLGLGEALGAYTFNFKGESVLEAMDEVMNSFGLNWWVSNDGVLYIGPDGTRGQLLASRSGYNEIALARYTVTERSKTVNAVQLRGSALSLEDIPQYYERQSNKAPRVLAEASAPNIEGDLLVEPINQSFSSLEDLESHAQRRLFQETMDDISGSMEINGLASSDTSALRKLNVGDYFYAGPGIEADCNENVETGFFMITSIQHLSDERRGWRISVGISRVPNPLTLETTSVYYDPLTDKKYESLAAYSRATFDEEDIPGAT